MRDAMDELGLSITDSNGEMKSLDTIMKDIRGAFGGLTEQQKAHYAATIFGKEAMSGMLAVANASEADFRKLSKAINESDGKAKEMAETMQDNLQGSITTLKSALSEAAISIGTTFIPMARDGVESINELVDGFNGLDDGTKATIAGIAGVTGALALLAGPTLLLVGALPSIIAGGSAIIAGLTVMAPAIVGVTALVASLGAVWYASREQADEAVVSENKLAETNLKLAESYTGVLEKKEESIGKTSELIEQTKIQASEVDGLVTAYEGLAEKSQLTNEEMANYLTLQSELSHTTTPERVNELEQAMEGLREKSGLSRAEFDQLLETNSTLAELFPQSAAVVDEYGNRIADTTGKLQELTQAELDRASMEVYNKLVEDVQTLNTEIGNYQTLIGEVMEAEQNVTTMKQEQRDIASEIKDNNDKIAEAEKNIAEIKLLQKDASLQEYFQLEANKNQLQGQKYELERKNEVLGKNKKTIDDTVKTEEKNLREKQKQRDLIGQMVADNRQNLGGYIEILQKQHNITLEKGKEVEGIHQIIEANNQNIKALQTQIEQEGDSNGKKQEAIEKLQGQNSELGTAAERIGALNGQIDTQNQKYDQGEGYLLKQNDAALGVGTQIDNNSTKADNLNQKLDKDNKKNVDIQTSKDPDDINSKLQSPISKTVSIIANVAGNIGKILGFARGTNNHPGGISYLGEQGAELVKYNGKYGIADYGLYNMPKGAVVYNHSRSKAMLSGGLGDKIGMPSKMLMPKVQGSMGMATMAIKEANFMKRAVNGEVGNMITSTRDMLGINSPSRVYYQIGLWVSEGLALGIADGGKKAIKAMQEVAYSLTDVMDDQLSKEQEIHEKHSEERKKIIQRSEEDIRKIQEAAWAKKRKTNEQENIKIRRIQEDANKKLKDMQTKANKDIHKLSTTTNKALLDELKRYVDDKKSLEQLSLKEEAYIWKESIKLFEDGSAEKIRAQQNYNKTVATIQGKIDEVNKYYSSEVQRVDKETLNAINAINDGYQKAYNDRFNQLNGFAGLFDEFKIKQDVTGKQLTQNLASQLNALKTFNQTIGALDLRIGGTTLYKELEAMGPKATAELQALNNMTDEELQRYVEMFEEKAKIANERTTYELKEQRKNADKEIKGLKDDAIKQLQQLKLDWRKELASINKGTQEELAKMRGIGKDAGLGLALGLADAYPDVQKAVDKMASFIDRGMRNALDIHSPSRKSMAIGEYYGEGLSIGMLDTLRDIEGSKNAMVDAMEISRSVGSYKADLGKTNSINVKQPAIINLNVGNERLAEFLIDDINAMQGMELQSRRFVNGL